MKSMVCNTLAEWKKAREEGETSRAQQQLGDRVWSKPPVGWTKINVNAACKHGAGFIGVGCVARDTTGAFIRARSNVIRGDMSPQMAEAVSLQEALLWAKAWGGNRCVFESDSKLLVEAVNGSMGKSYFHTIVSECREIIKHFEEVLVVFVHRYANMIAHTLARATYSTSGLQEWVHTPPEYITCNIFSEQF